MSEAFAVMLIVFLLIVLQGAWLAWLAPEHPYKERNRPKSDEPRDFSPQYTDKGWNRTEFDEYQRKHEAES